MRQVVLILSFLVCGFADQAHATVVLGDWSSPDGFPTSSSAPGYAFVTAHDEGALEAGIILPGTSGGEHQAFYFPITNNHPTLSIEIDTVSLTLSGPGSEVAIAAGEAPDVTQIADSLALDVNSMFLFSRQQIDPVHPGIYDVGPGETFYVIPYDPGVGGSFGVQNVTVSGTLVPEGSTATLISVAAFLLSFRRRRP